MNKKTIKTKKNDTMCSKGNLMDVILKLKPFLTDSSNYFGCYEEDVKELCRIIGWNRN